MKDCIKINIDWEYDATVLFMDSSIYIDKDDENEFIGKIQISMDGYNPIVDILPLCGKNIIRNAVLCNNKTIIDTLLKEIDDVNNINKKEANNLIIDTRSDETNVILELDLVKAIEDFKKEIE